MTTLDLLYLAFLAIGLLCDHFVLWRGFLRRSRADPGRARVWLWSSWIILLWMLAAAGVVLWSFEGRKWNALRFITPHGWRLWCAIGLVVVLAIINIRSALRIARTSKRVKLGNPELERAIPRTRLELSWFVALSLSAGFCEEFIFRGYLIWAFQPVFGLWGAAALSLAVFAAAHAYQGIKGVLNVAIVGGLFTLVVLLLGSLWPAIALHVLTDIGSGLIAWLVFQKMQGDTRVA